MSSEYVPTQPQDANRIELTASAERGDKLPQLGDILLDKFRITAKKEGGFGAVLFVTDIFTNQKYAVKTYKPEYSNEEQFKSEVDFWINLDAHPNIVKAYFVEVVNKRPFLFIEYISGNVLRDLVGKLTIHQAINFAYQICVGMKFANQERKMVHGDLKPENVLVALDSIAKITDFGLAKHFDSFSGELPRETSGTIPYMSYEQLNGEVLDERSDIFSFGIMFFEMLQGYLPYPFDGTNLNGAQWREYLKKFYEDINFYADDFRSLPWRYLSDKEGGEVLVDIVMKCIFPERDNRHRSFKKLCQLFEHYLNQFLDQSSAKEEINDLHQRAMALYRIGQVNKALTIFNLALKENPSNAEIWRDAAVALVDINMLSTATEFVIRAKNLNPEIDIDNPKLASLL